MQNILLVDDDAVTLELLKHVLSECVEGEVFAFSSSAKAIGFIEAMQCEQLAMVISDWQMPVYDGLSILKAFRAKCLHTPFLMLTANGTKDLVLSAKKSGVTDFIVKPFSTEQLAEKVTSLLK